MNLIHVNPPSFVRSLRHFGIAENLRPGDEHLRHLAVTSRLKKLRIFLAINSENSTPFLRLFDILFLRGCTAIYGWRDKYVVSENA